MISQWVIDEVVVPLFTKTLLSKTHHDRFMEPVRYSLELAQNAKKHSEYMSWIGYVCKSAPGYKGEAFGEIVHSIKYHPSTERPLDERVLQENFEGMISALWRRGELRANLCSCTEVGAGIIFNELTKIFYITLRFAGSQPRSSDYDRRGASLARANGIL